MTGRAVLLALFLAGCSTPYGDVVRVDRAAVADPLPWAFACEFPAELQAEPRAAFGWWSDAAARELFREQPCVPAGEGIEGVLVELAKSGRADDAFTMGFTFPAFANARVLGASVTFYPEWVNSDASTRTSAARHEIGHVLGFGHAAEPRCLMYPDAFPGEELCPAEIDAVHALYSAVP